MIKLKDILKNIKLPKLNLKDIKPSKALRLAIILFVIIIIIAGVLIGKAKVDMTFIERSKIVFTELSSRLKLDRIPFIGRFLRREAAPPLTEEMPEELILVKVYKVARRDFDDSMPSLGTIKGYREMDLKFEVNGVVDSINFREGEEVREGDIIASLDQYDALLKLKYSKIELDKNKKFHEIGSIVKSRLEQAELEYESAKSDLDKTYLYAPRDGVLGTRDAEVGEFVTTNDKIVTLIDDSDIFVEIGVITRDIGKVKIGQNAKVSVDTYPDTDFKGKVDNVSPVVEGRTRTQTTKIRVDNPERLLLPGMFARVLIDIYSKKDAIVIPNSALNKGEEGYVTFVVHKLESEEEIEAELFDKEGGPEALIEEEAGEEGIAEERPILFEYRSSDFSVIKEGLEEGELVVVETQEKLRDKMKVIITEVQEQFL